MQTNLHCYIIVELLLTELLLMNPVDYADCCTAFQGMKALCTDFERRQQGLVFTNITPGVERGLKALNEKVTIAKTPEELAVTVTSK